jgi:hypothetical protein
VQTAEGLGKVEGGFLSRENAFVEDVARGGQNLMRGAVALVRVGPPGSASVGLDLWVRFEGVTEVQRTRHGSY